MTLIVVGGLPGTGKSTLADALAVRLAVPVFTEFMQDALKGKPPTPFNMPPGMTQIWIDPATGVKANVAVTASTAALTWARWTRREAP